MTEKNDLSNIEYPMQNKKNTSNNNLTIESVLQAVNGPELL